MKRGDKSEKIPKRPTADLTPLKTSVQQILASTRILIEKASNFDWDPADGVLSIICRAVLRRQFDSLEAISQMVAQEKGFLVGSFLRQKCEEFIWIKYLVSIPPNCAEQLVKTIVEGEVYGLLDAQDNAMGSSETEKLGLAPYLEEMRESKGSRQDSFCTLAKELNWPKPESGRTPPMLWLAKKVGEKQIYELIYNATSRFVHFSPTELVRLVKDLNGSGKLSVRPIDLNLYRGAFSLYWGAHIFLYTIEEAFKSSSMLKGNDALAKEFDRSALKEFLDQMGGTPPIIGIWEVAPRERWQD